MILGRTVFYAAAAAGGWLDTVAAESAASISPDDFEFLLCD